MPPSEQVHLYKDEEAPMPVVTIFFWYLTVAEISLFMKKNLSYDDFIFNTDTVTGRWLPQDEFEFAWVLKRYDNEPRALNTPFRASAPPQPPSRLRSPPPPLMPLLAPPPPFVPF